MSPVKRKYIPKEVSQVAVANIRRRRGGVRKIKGGVLSGRRGESQQVRQQDGLQSFNEPGNSLVNVCQRSIFLSLFLRQSNQCLSLSPFALIPRDTPPERRNKEDVSHMPNAQQNVWETLNASQYKRVKG